MEYVAAGSETGIDVPAPYARSIQVLFAPDRRAVDELTFSLVQAPMARIHDEPPRPTRGIDRDPGSRAGGA